MDAHARERARSNLTFRAGVLCLSRATYFAILQSVNKDRNKLISLVIIVARDFSQSLRS